MKKAFSYGIASMKIVAVFRDPHAATVTAYQPEFRIAGCRECAPKDIVILRLDEKKDHREIQMSKANAYTGESFEYPPKSVVKTVVTDDGGYRTVKPAEPLKPGEYILFAGTPLALPIVYDGYDFEVK